MSDPLTDVVALLNPKPSHAKLVEGAGVWRITREVDGEAFFCAVLEGECLITINGEAPRLLVAGDFILIPATYSLENTNTGSLTTNDITMPKLIEDNHVRIGTSEGKPELLMYLGHCAFDTQDKQLILSLLPQTILIKGQRRFLTLFELLLDESKAKWPGREVVLTQLLQLLLIESLRGHGDVFESSGILAGLQHEKISHALHKIHEQPSFNWQVTSLASEASMSRSSFFATFNKVVGVPPMQYVLFWRMSLAKKALLTTPDKIEQIAFQVGYQSSSAFNVAFSKYVGMPPGAFRERGIKQ